MLAVVAAVIVLDQSVKWWAWRHVAGVKINSGGDVLVGPAIGAWYAAPVTGALLDLLDFGLLSAALFILARRHRPAAVLVFGALMLGGWGSNLLDRLGMHYWTAPGSVRGVVDFIRIAGASYNVADLFIIGATPLFLLAVGFLGLRHMLFLLAGIRVGGWQRRHKRTQPRSWTPGGANPVAASVGKRGENHRYE